MDRFYKGVQAYKNTVMFVKTLKDDDHENLEHWIYQVLP